jgi:hypothetical protein
MGRLALFCALVHLAFVGTIQASDPSFPAKDGLPTGAQGNGDEHLTRKAFADAVGKVNALKPYPDRREDPTLPPLAPWYEASSILPCTPWHRLAADTRPFAGGLAERQGKEIAPYVGEHADVCPLLALLTLDELGLHDDAARAVVKLLAKRKHHVLLSASFCSVPTREATANLLASLPGADEHPERVAQLHFFIATGNAKTVELLGVKARQWEEDRREFVQEAKRTRSARALDSSPHPMDNVAHALQRENPYQAAADRISARLSLPEKLREQRANDELLLWQTAVSAPSTVDQTQGWIWAAQCLAAQKLTISPGFLIEVLEAKELTHENMHRIEFALAVIMCQRENSAVPAIVALDRRLTGDHSLIERVLRQIDTPEARKALEDLRTGAH